MHVHESCKVVRKFSWVTDLLSLNFEISQANFQIKDHSTMNKCLKAGIALLMK